MLVSLELAVKKEEFSKLMQSNSEPEGVVIEEVIVSSTSKTNFEEANLRCPKCGTNAGIEAYYNNSDNICYMTYCTKCVHEHGLYVRLETDEEETQGARSLAEAQKRKKESEAKKMQEKCKDFVEFTKDESRAKSMDSNPVSRVLRGRSHYEVISNPLILSINQNCTFRFSGCQKVPQTKRSAWLSASLRELFTRTRIETPGLERPLPKSSR